MQAFYSCVRSARSLALLVLGLFLSSGRTANAGAAARADEADLAAVRADEAHRVAAFAKAARSVVCVFEDRAKQGGGSGVVISEDGYGLTNVHVVMSFLEKRRGFGGLSDGNLYPLTVLGIDPGGDIAMFKLEGKPRFDAAPLGDSDRLAVGQWVAAMGNPFLVADDLTPTITLGIISGLHRYQEGQGNVLEYADCIQVSTSINPGNSGGPLFDLDGRLVGINGRASFEERGRVNIGLGYAVSVNQIKRFLPTLQAGQLCEHGTLGATFEMAGDDLIINALQELSPAERAGARLGDQLLSINGRSVRTPNEVNNLLAILPSGWPVRFAVKRDEHTHSLTARLERIPVKLPKPYLVDIKHNHTEIRRLLARALQPTGAANAALPASINYRGVLRRTSGGDADERRVRVTHQPWGKAMVEPEGAAADTRIWTEWAVLSSLWQAPAPVTAGWELLGGDEVDGRIAGVIEHRVSDELRVRWKLDWETGRFLGATVGTDKEPEAAAWRVVQASSETTPGELPRSWQRSAGEQTVELTIDELDRSTSTGPRDDGAER